MERVGIRDICPKYYLDENLSIKKDILLFDTVYYSWEALIYYVSVLGKRNDPTPTEIMRKKAEEIQELEKHDLIKRFDERYFSLIPPEPEINKETLAEIERIDKSLKNPNKERKQRKHVLSAEDFSNGMASYLATTYSGENGFCTPILYDTKDPFSNIKDHGDVARQTTLSVILKSIPTIPSDISVSQLKEFKADNDARDKFLALRNFMISLSKEKLTESEMHERIEYLLNEYEQQLKLHKAKLERSSLQTFLLTTADFAENIATLKFSKALKAIMDVQNKEIELLEAERKFTGREAAYIHKIKTELGNKETKE